MQVTISGRHMAVSEEMQDYCREKVQRLPRYYDRVQSIEVVLDGKDGHHTAELIVHSDGTPPLVAHEAHDDLHAAVDLVLDKMERQLTRLKEKLRNRKHPPRTPDEVTPEA